MKGVFKHKDEEASRRGPFVPGQGQIPPYLAGRETEQALIRKLFSWLASRQPPGSDLLIYGPRGNGKTALMEWARREARGRKIGTLKLSSREAQSTERLVQRLSVLPRWLRSLKELSAGGVKFKKGDPELGRITDALARRARSHGLVFAIDEAHTLAVDVGQDVLHAVQRLRSEGVPVMLLLAGTPDLPVHLSEMDASFWGRSRKLALGLLAPDAAADAIRVPLEAEGRSIADKALAQVVAESHGYPYFLQLWGDLLWDAMSETARPASLDDVERVRPLFKTERNTYYRDRYVELERAELDGVAANLSLAFADASKRTSREVNEVIRLALASEGRGWERTSVIAVRDRLHDLGYIWSGGGESRLTFQPGIPSLMRFVARCRDIDLPSERA